MTKKEKEFFKYMDKKEEIENKYKDFEIIGLNENSIFLSNDSVKICVYIGEN